MVGNDQPSPSADEPAAEDSAGGGAAPPAEVAPPSTYGLGVYLKYLGSRPDLHALWAVELQALAAGETVI